MSGDRTADNAEVLVDGLLRACHEVRTEPLADLDAALAETFGALPDLEVPARSEWQVREPRLA
jgi:hypothetical protein